MTLPAKGLLHRLRSQFDTLPTAQRKVVQIFLDDPEAASAATVEKLAQQSAVSMPTVVRTCRCFGYDSVREFMLALAQDLALSGSHLHRSVLADDSTPLISEKITRAASMSITELNRQLDTQVLDSVAQRLAQASRIDCYSVGAASSFMASELQSRLFRLGRPAHAISDAHQQLVSASTLGPQGVAFVISHVGRMPYAIEAARYAREQGATVVALTQPGTPLAQCADLLIGVTVPPDAVMRVGIEAYLAHLLVIEILMVRLGQLLGPQVVLGLQRLKSLLDEHGFDSAQYASVHELPNHMQPTDPN